LANAGDGGKENEIRLAFINTHIKRTAYYYLASLSVGKQNIGTCTVWQRENFQRLETRAPNPKVRVKHIFFWSFCKQLTRLANSLEDAKPHLRPHNNEKLKALAACRNARRSRYASAANAEAIFSKKREVVYLYTDGDFRTFLGR
jgi:hypothetical protein